MANLSQRLFPLLALGGGLFSLFLACQSSSSPEEPSAPAGTSGGLSGQGGASPSGGGSGGSKAKAGAAGVAAAGSGGSSGTGAEGGAAPYGIPLVVGPDWLPYQPPVSPCVYHFMPKGGTPPSPVEWEPCEPNGLQGVECQQRKQTLPGIIEENASPIHWDPWANPPHMRIARVRQARWELIYWRLDGTFAGAIGYKGELPDQCHLLSGGRNTDSIYAFEHMDVLVPNQSFVIAGRVGEIPSFARGGIEISNESEYGKTYYGTSDWIIAHKSGEIQAFPWGNEEKKSLLYSPSKHWAGLPGYPAFGHQSEYFLKVNSSGKSGWLSWTPETGIRDLLLQSVTSKRGFTSFNTDGHDIVFTYGEDATKSYAYTRYTLMKATYSTDPEIIAKTAVAVANVPRHTSTRSWAVGCGYAVMGSATEEEGVSLIVVRLSDGQLWRKWPVDPKDFGGIVPVAVTCQDLFIQAGFQSRLQQIALDSLGPGEPSPPQIGAWPF